MIKEMWKMETWVLQTYKMRYDPCQKGLNDFVESYLQNETRICGFKPVAFARDQGKVSLILSTVVHFS